MTISTGVRNDGTKYCSSSYPLHSRIIWDDSMYLCLEIKCKHCTDQKISLTFSSDVIFLFEPFIFPMEAEVIVNYINITWSFYLVNYFPLEKSKAIINLQMDVEIRGIYQIWKIFFAGSKINYIYVMIIPAVSIVHLFQLSTYLDSIIELKTNKWVIWSSDVCHWLTENRSILCTCTLHTTHCTCACAQLCHMDRKRERVWIDWWRKQRIHLHYTNYYDYPHLYLFTCSYSIVKSQWILQLKTTIAIVCMCVCECDAIENKPHRMCACRENFSSD